MSNDFQFLDTKRQEPNKHPIHRRKNEFIEIYQPLEQTQVDQQADRCLDCGNPYCEWQCPLHNYIPNWLSLVKQGRIMEAADKVHQTNTLPEMCGRVCPQDRLCEGACTLNDEFGAVTIGKLEQYIADTAIAQGWRPNMSHTPKRKERVAIVGAGPAGLGCADILARNGIAVEVFDKYPQIGGLLTYGIPSFKLDKSTIATRRIVLESMGIKFKLGVTVGEDIPFNTLLNDYDAVFLAMGTYQAISGNLANESSPGVYQALPYLIGNTYQIMGNISAQYPYQSMEGKRVVVLGGGDTAMDCVRTAIRQGATSVSCVYRRDEHNMPGSAREVTNAKEEGAVFLFNRQPTEITLSQGKLAGITCVTTKLGDADSSGRRRPQIVKESEQLVEADAVIIAFGFQPSPPAWFTEHNIELNPNDTVMVTANNALPFQTSNTKVFAGGDMVRGSDLVVTAIAEGRQAAQGILEFLS